MVSFLTKVLAHHSLKPALNEGTAIFQPLAVLGDDDMVAIVNHAYTLAFGEGSQEVSWADIREAFIAWQGKLFCTFGWIC